MARDSVAAVLNARFPFVSPEKAAAAAHDTTAQRLLCPEQAAKIGCALRARSITMRAWNKISTWHGTRTRCAAAQHW